MDNKLSVLISSCTNFSDLWDENIKAYRKFWPKNPFITYLVTDTKTSWNKDEIKVIVAEGEKDFPLRIRYALDLIETPYVLLTLDDYFLIDPVSNDKISYLLRRMESEKIQYLSLYNRQMAKKRKRKLIEELSLIDLSKKYALTLYPAIWDVEFLKKTVKDDMNPWLYEVSLTKCAIEENANCQASFAGAFNILDVVRKGKVLHKAQRYFKRNGINIGDRPRINYRTELKLFIFDVISWYTPKKIFKAIKSVARKCGMKFYSED